MRKVTSYNGMGAEDIYVTKSKFFELLKFLTCYVNVKASHTTNMHIHLLT